jgi:ectoine hydroxylase-related dioxygenase (phytanoyl-CoA dioxygenase family)
MLSVGVLDATHAQRKDVAAMRSTRRAPPLRAEQVQAFYEQGFAVVADVFRPKELVRMRAAFDRLEQVAFSLHEPGMHRGSQFVIERGAQTPAVRIHRIVWCGAAEPVLSRYGMDDRLLAMAAQLLGSREMNQLINQAHYKHPGDGVEFPWHQDSTHRRFGQDVWRDVNGRGSYVQTVTAIDDVDDDNGPLRLIPGSCRLGHIGDVVDGTLPASLDEHRAFTARMPAGSVLLFGPYTFHSSPPNRSARTRRIFINGFACTGANSRVYPGDGAGRLVRAPG